jgi:sulfonate transport system ATP-binding protein
MTRADLQDHLLDLWADTRPTLILVTHDVDEAIVLADRVMVMRPRPGRIFSTITADIARPRNRQSAEFDHIKNDVLAALDHSLMDDRSKRDAPRGADARRAAAL